MSRPRGSGCVATTALALTLAATALLCASPARAVTVDQSYRVALAHYYAGRYDQAIEGLERIVELPTHHEDLFYNLGCAYFRRGKLGPAIYNFERSLQLDPDRDDARHNLETARTLVRQRVTDVLKGAAGTPLWARVVGALTQLRWSVIFLAAWWLLFGLFFVLRRVDPGPLRAGLIAGSSLLALLTLLCGALLVGRIYLDQRVQQAVVLPDRVAVHEGTAATTKTLFNLHAGLKVQLIGEDQGWARLRLGNGLEGWVERDQLGHL